MAHRAHLISISATLALLSVVLGACNKQPADQHAPPATRPVAASAKPLPWKRIHDASVVAVNDPTIERALADASAQAHHTLDDARQRWTIAKTAERALWAVKWAAPLASPTSTPTTATTSQPMAQSTQPSTAAVEHIWVQPINWSAFRIEGVLLSDPASPLECGRSAGEIISFPIDELSDWIHFAADPATNPNAPFEGGYTVKVLEEKYGQPGR